MIKYRELKRRYELDGPQRTVAHLAEALGERQLRPEDFSLRDLAEALVPDGGEWLRRLDPRSGGGVDVSAFLNVAGQVIYAKIMDAYRHEAFVVSRLVETIPTRLDGEKIPGAARLADGAAAIEPGMPYPHLGFGEDYVETPSTTKHGLIVPVTREAIFFDRTHLVLSRAAEVGEILGLNKEKRLVDLVVGATNNYKWRGTAYDTYQTAAPWINVRATQVLVMPAYRHAANRVFKAAEIAYTADGVMTTTGNLLGNYRVYESRLAYRRITASGVAAEAAKKWWFLGDFAKAFAYMENWPITVTQSPRGSEAEFTNDVVVRFKASERGAAAVLNPRHVVKCYDT